MNRDEIKKFIHDMLENGKKLNIISMLINGKKYPKIKESIIKETRYLPEESKTGERIYHILNDKYERLICPNCKINYLKYSTGRHQIYCSSKCRDESIDVKIKKRKTNLHNCGHEYPFQSFEFKEKRKQVMIDKYDCEYPLQNKKIQEKAKQTNLERHGVENVFQSKKIQEKSKQTMIDRYGVEYAYQSEEIQEKAKQTNLERHGVENVFQSKKIQEKIKETNREKYGYEYPLQNKEIQEKQKQTNLKRHGCEYPTQIIEVGEKIKADMVIQINEFIKNIDIEMIGEYNGCVKHIRFKCLKCDKEFQTSWLSIQRGKRCPYCSTHFKQSKEENELFDFLKSMLIGEIIRNDTQVIKNPKTNYPLELDFYIPEKKIAIEYNGLYWHCDLHKDKDINYHLMKTNLCKEKEIQLIHIFEDEWIYKKDIVKLKLKQLLGVEDEKINLNKCEIKEINMRSKNKFLEKHNIQGNDNSSICIGIFYKNKLISVMTFLNHKDNIFELVNYCSKYNYHVSGMMLNHFKDNYDWKEIYSYIDLRWDDGKEYEELGFELDKQIKPKYWMLLDGGGHVYTRVKSNTVKPEDQDKYLKIYDCGYLKYKMII